MGNRDKNCENIDLYLTFNKILSKRELNEETQDFKDIYDMMAFCGVYVLRYCKKNNILPVNIEVDKNICECLSMIVDKYIKECYADRINALASLRNTLIDIISDIEPKEVVKNCYCMFELLGHNIEYNPIESIKIKKIISLNRKYTDTIRILPLMGDTFPVRSNLKYQEDTHDIYSLFRAKPQQTVGELGECFDNYIIYTDTDLLKYETEIYYLGRKNPITGRFIDKDSFSIGVTPFINRNIKEVLNIKYIDSKFEKNNKFYVESVKEEFINNLAEAYSYVIKSFQDKDADFIVFPEMLTSNEYMRCLNRDFSKIPSILFNGTIWENKTNRCIVSDTIGNIILTYYKKNAFILKDGKTGKRYFEMLQSEVEQHKKICFVDIKDFGRIGVLICKDAYSDEIMTYVAKSQADILFVPMFSDSYDMLENVEHYAKRYNIIIVLVNACSAFGKDSTKPIMYVVMPFKAKDGARSAKSVPGLKTDRCKNCVDGCTGFDVNINFMSYDKDETGITYKMNINPS